MQHRHLSWLLAGTAIAVIGTLAVFAWLGQPSQRETSNVPAFQQPVAQTPGEQAAQNIPCEGPVDAMVTIANPDVETPTYHVVTVNGTQALGIETHEELGFEESEASLYRQTDCFAYVEVSATGRGGYIFYGGPDTLYRIDLRTLESKRIVFDGFLMDLSPDETMVASRSDLDGTQGTFVSVEITDIASGSHRQIQVPGMYNDAGGGKFSPDSRFFALGAVYRDDETLDPSQQAVITIDLSTGTQTITAADVRSGYPVYVSGWSKGGVPEVSDTL